MISVYLFYFHCSKSSSSRSVVTWCLCVCLCATEQFIPFIRFALTFKKGKRNANEFCEIVKFSSSLRIFLHFVFIHHFSLFSFLRCHSSSSKITIIRFNKSAAAKSRERKRKKKTNKNGKNLFLLENKRFHLNSLGFGERQNQHGSFDFRAFHHRHFYIFFLCLYLWVTVFARHDKFTY